MTRRFAGLSTVYALAALSASAAYSDSKPIAQTGEILTAGNDFLQIHIQSTPGSGVGEFTVTDAAGNNVLYGNGRPGTSYTTVHSYTTNTDYVQGSNATGFSIDSFGVVTPIGSTGFEVTYTLPGAPVTPDKMTIVQDIAVTGDDAADSQVRVTTFVVDTGDTPLQVGVRYLWDYDLDGDDGPILDLATGQTPNETTLSTPSATVTAVDGSSASSVSDPGAAAPAARKAPDRVSYVSWPTAFKAPFDYTLDPAQTAGGKDSALLTYFGSTSDDAITVSTGATQSVTATITANWAKPVTVTVKPEIVVPDEEVTATASSAPDADKVTWKAPGGTPEEGTGLTFTTSYAKVGQKTISVAGLAEGAPKSVVVNVVKVNFEINGQTDKEKSLAMLKNTVGVIKKGVASGTLRLTTPCVAWVEGTPNQNIKVVLTNPDTRLSFTRAFTPTTNLTLPANGDKVGFVISGETKSGSVGDAVINAELNDDTKKLLGKQPVTVFYFDPVLTLTPGGEYVIADGRYQPTAGTSGIALKASAEAKPAGVDVAVGLLAQLKISIAQNQLTIDDSTDEINPRVRWEASINAGTEALVPSTLKQALIFPNPSNDTDANDDPLYVKKLADPNGPAMADSDSPSTPERLLNIPVKDSTGRTVGTAIYTIDKMVFNSTWRDWAVAYDPDTTVEYPLRQGDWKLAFDTKSAAADQKAKDYAFKAAADPPLRGAPFSNDVVKKPSIVLGAVVKVVQPAVKEVTLSVATVVGGAPVTGTVTLTAPAGADGTAVRLGTNNAAAGKPKNASALVPAGELTVEFPIDTFAVTKDERVRIAASCNSQPAAAAAILKVTK